MHHLHPVAQAVQDEPAHHGMAGIERIAAARVVGVAAAGLQQVVGAVVQPAQAAGGAVLVAFVGVVEDHVQDHFQPGAVQGLDQVAEFVQHRQRLRGAAVAGVRREERERRIAPVVGEARRCVLHVEGEHRHQLDRGDAQVHQVGDLLHQRGVAAAPGRGHAGAGVLREAAHVQLVDGGGGEGALQRRVAFPVVAVIVGDHALGRHGVVAPGFAGGGAAVAGGQRDGTAVGVEQHLAGVEAQAAVGVVRTVRAPGIDLPRRHAGHEGVPVVAAAVAVVLQRNHPRRRGGIRTAVQQQVQPLGMAREDAEIRAVRLRPGAQRVRPAAGHGFGAHTSIVASARACAPV